VCVLGGGGSVMSLAVWNIGAWLVPVMISIGERERGVRLQPQ